MPSTITPLAVGVGVLGWAITSILYFLYEVARNETLRQYALESGTLTVAMIVGFGIAYIVAIWFCYSYVEPSSNHPREWLLPMTIAATAAILVIYGVAAWAIFKDVNTTF